MLQEDPRWTVIREEQSRVAFERDPIWDAMQLQEPGDFEAIADTMRFRDEVPDAVAGRFEEVRRLVRYAFFDYDLMDVAYERAALTFDTAVKKRHDELGGPHQTWKAPLAAFIEWGVEQNLFEDGKRAADAARELRNGVAHPKHNSRRGPVALRSIQSFIRMINELYDDPELRRERNEIRDNLNARLEEIVGVDSEHGAIIEEGENRLLVYMATVLHVENQRRSEEKGAAEGSSKEPLIYLAFLPIFDPSVGKAEELKMSRPILRAAWPWEADESGGVSFYTNRNVGSEEDRTISIGPIWKKENRDRYQKWKAAVEETTFQVASVRSFAYRQLSELRRATRNGDMVESQGVEVSHVGSAPVSEGEASYTVSG